jgi:hypothetical protein
MHLGVLAMLVTGVASANLEFMGDFGPSQWDASADGTPDLLFHDLANDQVVILYMHQDLDRCLEPADLNALGGEFYGPGTIGAIDVMDPDVELTTSDDVGALVVDNWGSGGEGLEGSYNVSGSVVEIQVLDGGSGFDSSELGYFDIDESGTGGSGLDIFFTALGGIEGEVQRVDVLDGGYGYEPGAELAVLNSDFISHSGDPLAGIAYVNEDGVIDRVDLVEGGSGFTETPPVSIFPAPSQGSGAEFTAFLAGAISQVYLNPNNPEPGGSGYTSNPILTPLGDGDADAFAYRMTRRGPITDVTVTNPGGKYVVPPVLGIDLDDMGGLFSAVLWEDLPADERPMGDRTGRVVITGPDGQPMELEGRKWRAYVGDLDGDFDQDIMWRQTWGVRDDGWAKVWFMDGGQVTESFDLQYPGEDWKPWKLADLNGDRRKELIWWDPTTADIAAWELDSEAVGGVGAGSWVAQSDTHDRRWRPYVVMPGMVGENDRILWRRTRPTYMAVADYAELDPGVTASWSPVTDSQGDVVVTAKSWEPWIIGNLNGDGDDRDILGVDRATKRLGVWQMDDTVVVHGGYLTWSGEEIRSRGLPRGLATHGEQGSVSLAGSDGSLTTTNVTTSSPLEPTDSELTDLLVLVDSLEDASAAQTQLIVADILDLLDRTPALVDYLRNPFHAAQVLGDLTDYARHEIEAGVAELADRSTVIDTTSTYAIDTYRLADSSGRIERAVPRLQPEPEDGGSDSSGGGGGGAGGSGGGDGSGSGSGGGDGSGGGGGDIGGGSGDGGGSGGGDSGGLPDNFDPNDPTTWPDGVDTFEELLEWLINNPQ